MLLRLMRSSKKQSSFRLKFGVNAILSDLAYCGLLKNQTQLLKGKMESDQGFFNVLGRAPVGVGGLDQAHLEVELAGDDQLHEIAGNCEEIGKLPQTSFSQNNEQFESVESKKIRRSRSSIG